MNAATRLASILIGHEIAVQRYGAGVARKIVRLLNEADKDLIGRLAARLARIDGRGVDLGPVSTQRLQDMLTELRALNASVYKKVGRALTDELKDFAQFEMGFAAKSLQDVVPMVLEAKIPPTTMLATIVTERPLEGALLSSWVAGLEEGRMRRLEREIRVGLVTGDTIDAMVRRIRGTRALGFRDGILDVSRRSAQSIALTATSHVSNQARQATWDANDDLVKGWTFLATLDSRTSVTCASLSGKVFPINQGPIPPRHIRCRSTSIPVLKSWRELGLDIDETPEGTRSSMDGQVAADIRFDDWLRSKPHSIAEDILGKSKAEAFKNGLPLERFTDASGKEYSLDDLRRLYPSYF